MLLLVLSVPHAWGATDCETLKEWKRVGVPAPVIVDLIARDAVPPSEWPCVQESDLPAEVVAAALGSTLPQAAESLAPPSRPPPWPVEVSPEMAAPADRLLTGPLTLEDDRWAGRDTAIAGAAMIAAANLGLLAYTAHVGGGGRVGARTAIAVPATCYGVSSAGGVLMMVGFAWR